MARSGKDGWTEDHLTALRREWRAGTPVEEIAQMLGRSEVSVRRAANRLGLRRDRDAIAVKAMATRKVDHDTAAILEMWGDGVPTDLIADKFDRTVRSIQLIAAYHKVRRPAWYLSAVRGKASVQQFAECTA